VKQLNFTIVTPSFRQLDYLACCIASVADQEGVSVEHIVQDAGSPGIEEFAEKMGEQLLKQYGGEQVSNLEKLELLHLRTTHGYTLQIFKEKDEGMYDAVNKGLKKGKGKICAYLNCDEQYLQGALESVKAGLEKNEDWEVLYGGFLVVGGRGELITAQRPVKMFWAHVGTSHLANFTCATFFTREMMERERAYFDTQYKWCGDAVWTMERLKKGTKVGRLDRFTSAFVEAGSNQGIEREGLTEAERILDGLPSWVRWTSALSKLWHRIRKLLCGGYFPQRVSYDVFMKTELEKRRHFPARWANPFWGSRLRMS
jgi:glycosyltransferase involved in cell wall biosynthesis